MFDREVPTFPPHFLLRTTQNDCLYVGLHPSNKVFLKSGPLSSALSKPLYFKSATLLERYPTHTYLWVRLILCVSV
jgi:hypothetical protein